MAKFVVAIALAAVLTPLLLFSQGNYGRRTRGVGGVGNPGYDGPAVTFQGKLKVLTKGELRIEVSAEESIDFRITRKTHFLKDGKPIKPADIAEGVIVAVDAQRDPDQKLSAKNVIVDPPKPKTPEQ